MTGTILLLLAFLVGGHPSILLQGCGGPRVGQAGYTHRMVRFTFSYKIMLHVGSTLHIKLFAYNITTNMNRYHCTHFHDILWSGIT